VVQLAWAEAGGVPSRTDALDSPEFLDAAPWNPVYAESVPRLRDFWNIPEYAKLLNIQNTNVNAALTGTKDPEQALNDIAAEEQAVLDDSGGL
jgi:multiple sugar transport system substrate-binding protein